MADSQRESLSWPVFDARRPLLAALFALAVASLWISTPSGGLARPASPAQTATVEPSATPKPAFWRYPIDGRVVLGESAEAPPLAGATVTVRIDGGSAAICDTPATSGADGWFHLVCRDLALWSGLTIEVTAPGYGSWTETHSANYCPCDAITARLLPAGTPSLEPPTPQLHDISVNAAGRVMRRRDGQPITGAFAGLDARRCRVATYTDSEGRFFLRCSHVYQHDPLTLDFAASGYYGSTREVRQVDACFCPDLRVELVAVDDVTTTPEPPTPGPSPTATPRRLALPIVGGLRR